MESAEEFVDRMSGYFTDAAKVQALKRRDRAVAAEAMERAAKIAECEYCRDTHGQTDFYTECATCTNPRDIAYEIRAAGDGKPQEEA